MHGGLAMIPAFAALPLFSWITRYWRLIAIAALFGAAFYAGWRAHKGVIDSEQAKSLRVAIERQQEEMNRNAEIGRKLEDGIEVYRNTSRNLDHEVYDATRHNAAARFDADSVRRVSARIAAGEEARERANPVPRPDTSAPFRALRSLY